MFNYREILKLPSKNFHHSTTSASYLVHLLHYEEAVWLAERFQELFMGGSTNRWFLLNEYLKFMDG